VATLTQRAVDVLEDLTGHEISSTPPTAAQQQTVQRFFDAYDACRKTATQASAVALSATLRAVKALLATTPSASDWYLPTYVDRAETLLAMGAPQGFAPDDRTNPYLAAKRRAADLDALQASVASQTRQLVADPATMPVYIAVVQEYAARYNRDVQLAQRELADVAHRLALLEALRATMPAATLANDTFFRLTVERLGELKRLYKPLADREAIKPL
jgi:hypothetical protein